MHVPALPERTGWMRCSDARVGCDAQVECDALFSHAVPMHVPDCMCHSAKLQCAVPIYPHGCVMCHAHCCFH
eukprot:scaffold189626_cov19-Tisochrysis_lutea.AAC.1